MSRNDDERAAGRAECFARLVLTGQQDAHHMPRASGSRNERGRLDGFKVRR